MPDIRPHLERNLAQAEQLGQTERAKKLKARLAEEEAPALSMSNSKAELLAAAEAEGIEVDESMTKAEILEALAD